MPAPSPQPVCAPDPLSDIADGSGVTCNSVERWSLRAPWGLRYPGSEHAVVHTVVRGQAVVAGVGAEPVRIRAGGAAVLPHDVPHVVASEWPLDEAFIIEAREESLPIGSVRSYVAAQDPDTVLMTMPFAVPGRGEEPLQDAPAQIRAVDGLGQDALRIGLLASSLVLTPGLGHRYIACRLSEAILAKVLQRMAGAEEDSLGLFSVFASTGVRTALRAVEGNVAHPWTVGELAELAGMSRSAFSAEFQDTVGTNVREFVSLRRVRRAESAIGQGLSSLADAAAAVGFRSKAALMSALTEVTARRPGARLKRLFGRS